MAGRSRPRTLVAKSPEEMESAVRERCLTLLSSQPRTRAELERSLARSDAPKDVVARVLDRLAHVGLVDDTAYAQAYVRTGVGVRRRGTRSLRAELRGRGVAPEVIDLAAQEVDEDDERATALDLVRRRAPGMARLAPEVRRRRLMGLLMRRGFNSSVINEVLAEVLAALDDEDDEGYASLDEDDLSESSAATGG